MNIRIGHGYDVHRFGGEGPVTLAGVQIPFEQGLIAHSDGDVAIHALCDALLGAAALGDIGKHFPDTDAAYENICSKKLLAHVIGLLKQQGWQLANADLTIIAERPKLAPYISAMQETLATEFQTDVSAINIKATTTEGLGAIGRQEGIAVHAVVLLISLA